MFRGMGNRRKQARSKLVVTEDDDAFNAENEKYTDVSTKRSESEVSTSEESDEEDSEEDDEEDVVVNDTVRTMYIFPRLASRGRRSRSRTLPTPSMALNPV